MSETLNNMPRMSDVATATAPQSIPTQNAEQAKVATNIFQLLKQLKEPFDESLIKERYGFKDKQGNTVYLRYIEWHVVCDRLDEIVGDWNYKIVNMVISEHAVSVTASITVRGVTREGCGASGQEDLTLAIKSAESDALKRAAVKFGIGRELYKKEDENFNDAPKRQQSDGQHAPAGKPADPEAGEPMTDAQKGKIVADCRRLGISPPAAFKMIYGKPYNQILSKKGASYIIQVLVDSGAELAAAIHAETPVQVTTPVQQPAPPPPPPPVQQAPVNQTWDATTEVPWDRAFTPAQSQQKQNDVDTF